MGLVNLTGRLANRCLKPFGVRLTRLPQAQVDVQAEAEQRPTPPRYVNIGAGGWRHPRWHNLDMRSDWYAPLQDGKVDFDHDLMSGEPLPFESGTVEAVFCSHVIEHLPDSQVNRLFEEVHRVLTKGGYFRVVCPDIRIIYDAFRRKDDFFMGRFAFHRFYDVKSLPQAFLHCFAAVLAEHHPYQECRKFSDPDIEQVFAGRPLEQALDFFVELVPQESQRKYPSCHMNWFHAEKLIGMLRAADFSDAWVSAFGQSRCRHMADTVFFDTTRPWMSLYAECRK